MSWSSSRMLGRFIDMRGDKSPARLRLHQIILMAETQQTSTLWRLDKRNWDRVTKNVRCGWVFWTDLTGIHWNIHRLDIKNSSQMSGCWMSPCLFEIPAEERKERLEAGTLKWTSDKIFHFGEANNSSKKGLEIGGLGARRDKFSILSFKQFSEWYVRSNKLKGNFLSFQIPCWSSRV